jgi:Zn-dependent protease
VPSLALSCPGCHKLVHADRLEELSNQAKDREAAKDFDQAQRLWREALALLPPESQQATWITQKIADLGATARTQGDTPKEQPAWIKRMGPFAALGAAAWKFKTFLLLALGKAKFLLLGLGKIKTVLSMAVSMGYYWTLFGWPFAIGFVLGIYVHEMGHVWALHRLGLRASAPMFIPGFGAFVSLYDSPASVDDDAYIGLAGPLWGAAAAAAFALAGILTGQKICFALAHSTAFINLFNLIPVWQLDGGRGFRALAFPQRLMMGGLFIGLWALTREGLFFLLLLGVAWRIFATKDHAPQGNQAIFAQFATLAIFFAVIARVTELVH